MRQRKVEGESKLKYFAKNVLAGGVSASVGEVFSIPIDCCKVRLQVQDTPKGMEPRYKGLTHTFRTVLTEEGPRALFQGLNAGVQRQMINAGIRIGMYEPVRNMITGELKPDQNPTMLQKISAGMITGAMGICVANPTDVVKVKLQAQSKVADPSKVAYKSTLDCYQKIVAENGIGGLWVGLFPNIMRNAIVNAAEVASYDQFKEWALQKFGMSDNFTTHCICGFSAGFVACVFASPADVLKTRMMNARVPYAGVGDAVMSLLRAEGPLGFYKGFVANFTRLGIWNIVLFVTLEKIRAVYF